MFGCLGFDQLTLLYAECVTLILIQQAMHVWTTIISASVALLRCSGYIVV